MPDGSGGFVDPHPATDGVNGELLEPSDNAEFRRSTWVILSVLAHQSERVPLAVDSQFDTLHLVTSEALVSTSVRVLEDGEG